MPAPKNAPVSAAPGPTQAGLGSQFWKIGAGWEGKMHENLQINVHSRRRFMEYLIHHAQYVGQYLYVKIASVTDMCVCLCRMCGLSFYVVTCSLIWLAPNMHDMHFWWQLPAPRRRRRLWGPSRILNGWMEQLGRTESWKRLKKKNMITPRSHFKRIVSWIEVFLFATKTFLMVFFVIDPTLQKTVQRPITTQTANLRRCDTLPSIGFLGFSMENQAGNVVNALGWIWGNSLQIGIRKMLLWEVWSFFLGGVCFVRLVSW